MIYTINTNTIFSFTKLNLNQTYSYEYNSGADMILISFFYGNSISFMDNIINNKHALLVVHVKKTK